MLPATFCSTSDLGQMQPQLTLSLTATTADDPDKEAKRSTVSKQKCFLNRYKMNLGRFRHNSNHALDTPPTHTLVSTASPPLGHAGVYSLKLLYLLAGISHHVLSAISLWEACRLGSSS